MSEEERANRVPGTTAAGIDTRERPEAAVQVAASQSIAALDAGLPRRTWAKIEGMALLADLAMAGSARR